MRARGLTSTVVILIGSFGVLGMGASHAGATCGGFTAASISPSSGPSAGGTTATIGGCGFSGSGTLSATIGGVAAAVTPISDTSISVVTPAGSPGSASVVVQLDTTAASGSPSFNYIAAPTLASTVPVGGPEHGGTVVHLTGTGFAPAGSTTTVKFGSVAATAVSNLTATTLTATAPAGTGTPNITVVVTLPSSPPVASNGIPFAYIPAPVVTSVSPVSGPVVGGTDVTLTGTGFQPGASVFFGPSDGSIDLTGDTSGTPVAVLNPTTVVVTTRPGIVGATNVVVVNPDNQSGALRASDLNHFSFTGTPPTVTTVSPGSGTSLGGTLALTVTGTGFLPGAGVAFSGATTVAVGSNGVDIASFTGSGAVNVISTGAFPAAGSLRVATTGGSAVIACTASTATSFTGCTRTSGSGTMATGGAVVEGNPPGLRRAVVSADGTTITGTTPAHRAGAVSVIVTNVGGGTASGAFTYIAAAVPTVTGVLAVSGPSLGGTQITVSGTNLVAGTTVSFGTAAAASAAVVDSSTISVKTPAHPAGAVTITVTLPDGQSAQLPSAFTFSSSPAPTISSVSPNTGLGGTTITINGSNFANTVLGTANAVSDAIVSVGNAPCVAGNTSADSTCLRSIPGSPTSPPIVLSNIKIQGIVPNTPGGTATITVTNPDGQTATSTFTSTEPVGPPTLATVSPATGPSLGRTLVTLTGTSFVQGATVTFGGNGHALFGSVTVSGGTTITALTPAGLYGLVDVTVTNPGGLTVTLPYSFTFAAAPRPTITSITPTSGPNGTQLTITGTGFASTNGAFTNAAVSASVTIGGQLLGPIGSTPLVGDSTTITGIVPNHPAGAVDVGVMNPDGQGDILAAGYTYPSDTAAPTITATGAVGGVPGYVFGQWAKGSVAVTLTADDGSGGSGVANISYRATGAQPIAQTTVSGTQSASCLRPTCTLTNLSISAQGSTSLFFVASDLAGNTTSLELTRTVLIDSIAPSVTATATVPSGGGTVPYTPGTPTNQSVTVTLLCADGGSGVATLAHSISSGSTETDTGTNPLSVTITSASLSAQSVTGTCTDVAGNVTTTTFGGIDITRDAPTISANAYAGGSVYVPGTWTNQTVTVTFSCAPFSLGSQIASLTSPVQVNGPVTDGSVAGTCIDTAGNSSTTSFTGIRIDRTLPAATATAATLSGTPYVAGTWTNQSVVVTFHCTEDGPNQSGVAHTDAPVTVTAAGTTAGVVGGCQDVAGNTANPPAFFGPILIDKTAPTCSTVATPNPIGPANGKMVTVTVTVTVSDANSGANGFVLVSVASNSPTPATDIVGFTSTSPTTGSLRATKGRTYTLTYKAFDVAGNQSALCSTTVTVR